MDFQKASKKSKEFLIKHSRVTWLAPLILCIVVFGIYITLTQCNKKADYQLFESIHALDVGGVREALNRGANPNAREPFGRGSFTTLKSLMWTLFSSHYEETAQRRAFDIAKLLLDKGAKIEFDSNSILDVPILEGYVPLVKLLLDHGASPSRKYDGRSPMEWATYYRQEAVVNLLEKYSVPKLTKKEKAQIRLIQAASDYELKGIRDALKSGAKINERDSSGKTPLIGALENPVHEYKQLLVVEYLLKQGADPNMTGKSGFVFLEGIPIHIIVFMSSFGKKGDSSKIAVQVMKKLLEHGAKVSAIDSRGRTPLHIAAEYDNIVAALLLVKDGCDIMPRDALSKTPLDYAKSKEMISLLKKHGAEKLH